MPLQSMILLIYLLDYLYLIFLPLHCFYTRLRGFAIIIIMIIIIKWNDGNEPLTHMYICVSLGRETGNLFGMA